MWAHASSPEYRTWDMGHGTDDRRDIPGQNPEHGRKRKRKGIIEVAKHGTGVLHPAWKPVQGNDDMH